MRGRAAAPICPIDRWDRAARLTALDRTNAILPDRAQRAIVMADFNRIIPNYFILDAGYARYSPAHPQ